MPEKKLRVTLDLSEKAAERLRRLLKLTEAESKAEVIRNSLQLYEYLTDQVSSGKKIFMGKSKDKSTEVILFHQVESETAED